MEVVVDLDAVTVVMRDLAELTKFSLLVCAPASAGAGDPLSMRRLGDVLAATNTGRLRDDGEAFISPEAVRFHAAGSVSEEWEIGFEKMRAYASTKGWIDSSDGFIQAHVEWPHA